MGFLPFDEVITQIARKKRLPEAKLIIPRIRMDYQDVYIHLIPEFVKAVIPISALKDG